MEDHIVQIVERVVSCFEKCVMKCYTKDDVLRSFLAVLRYAHRQFNTSNINPIEFWSKILSLADEHIFWKPTTLIIEICLCAPLSIASLERLFSKMNLIKTNLRNRLTNDSLNSILRVNISGLSLQIFQDKHLEKCVNYWFNAKNRRLSQRKRKLYKKRESQKTKQPHFNISDISSESKSSTDSSASEDEIIN